ncbi:uncharacterized protein CANTADRAFT_27831, partial [Suhomyces tanzawaensis NRRL Y-17324]
MADEDYTATVGFLHLVRAINNNPEDGTGIKNLIDFSHNAMGPLIPQVLVDKLITLQINLFGDYAKKADIAPSIVFCVVFFVIAICHLVIFLINFSRGHYFYISIGLVIYSMMRIVGFALRAVWAEDVTRIGVGLTSEILSIVPSIIIVSLNLILAQRLFTWRHPVGGTRMLFNSFMFGTYFFVLVVLAITVTAAFVPYLHYLSSQAYESWKKVNMATSILVILYSLTSISLIGLSYWAPTKKDERLYTYQPWWIDSFRPFYFVKPGAAAEAEETFMKRNHNHRHAVRVIAATHHNFNMVEGLTNQRGDLKHNKSIMILVVSTLFIFIGALGRSISIFQNRQQKYSSGICNYVAMYIIWGALEAIINILYIVGRIDLRFYRPDILPQKVRSIITAEQTYYPSEEEDEE